MRSLLYIRQKGKASDHVIFHYFALPDVTTQVPAIQVTPGEGRTECSSNVPCGVESMGSPVCARWMSGLECVQLLSARQCMKAARDLLLDLEHANPSLGSRVIKGHSEISEQS